MPFVAAIMILALWAAAGTGANPAALPAWVAPIRGQEKPTITVRVHLHQVVATARDDKGRIRNDLRKEDFILEDEGKIVEEVLIGFYDEPARDADGRWSRWNKSASSAEVVKGVRLPGGIE